MTDKQISRRVSAAYAEILSILANGGLGPAQTNEAIEAVLIALETDSQNDAIEASRSQGV